MPTIVIMFTLRMGTLVSIGFEQPMAFHNSLVANVSRVLSVAIYERGIIRTEYSMATTIGFAQSAVNLALILITNFTVKKIGHDALF